MTGGADIPIGAGAASDPRPLVRIAAALRRAIVAGAIPPGTRLEQA
jgi:DNA-binding GntR family transcriptional regulator